MGVRSPLVDAYIAKSRPFAQPILEHLREVVHSACPDVVEEMKWSMPHFTHHGMMAGMAAFKEHCTFGFWKAKLIMEQDEMIREAMGHFGCIRSLDDLGAEVDQRNLGWIWTRRLVDWLRLKWWAWLP